MASSLIASRIGVRETSKDGGEIGLVQAFADLKPPLHDHVAQTLGGGFVQGLGADDGARELVRPRRARPGRRFSCDMSLMVISPLSHETAPLRRKKAFCILYARCVSVSGSNETITYARNGLA